MGAVLDKPRTIYTPKPTILLIDENPETLANYNRYLANAGYKPIATTSPRTTPNEKTIDVIIANAQIKETELRTLKTDHNAYLFLIANKLIPPKTWADGIIYTPITERDLEAFLRKHHL